MSLSSHSMTGVLTGFSKHIELANLDYCTVLSHSINDIILLISKSNFTHACTAFEAEVQAVKFGIISKY